MPGELGLAAGWKVEAGSLSSMIYYVLRTQILTGKRTLLQKRKSPEG